MGAGQSRGAGSARSRSPAFSFYLRSFRIDTLDSGLVVESAAAVRERTLGDRIDRLLPKLGMTPADACRLVPPDRDKPEPMDGILD